VKTYALMQSGDHDENDVWGHLLLKKFDTFGSFRS